MLGGIAVRRRRSRVAGDMMIAVGPLPIVAFFWLILPPLAGIIVIVAAAFDAAEARSLGERGRPLVAGERLLLAGVVLAAAALVALLIAGSMPGTLIVASRPRWTDHLPGLAAAAPPRLSIRLRRAAVGILAGAETLPPLGGHLTQAA